MFEQIEIFGVEFTYYQIMAFIGAIVAAFYAALMTKKSGEKEEDMVVVLVSAAMGLLLGGHLLFGIISLVEHFPSIVEAWGVGGAKEKLDLVIGIFGGSVFYGGLIGGLGAGYLAAHLMKLNIIKFSDIGATTIPLFHFFGRIGCFLSGCCFGIECKHGFEYNYSIVEMANGATRFPVQLVEASLNLIIFIILFIFLKKEKFKGHLMKIYLGSYAVIRFILEFARGDAYRGIYGPFSTSQWISIGILVAVVIWICIDRRKGVKSVDN